MDEAPIIDRLKEEGYGPVYVYVAESGEVEEEHEHDFYTKLVVLEGDLSITLVTGGVVTNMNYRVGNEVSIAKGCRHSAKVGDKGCRYIVAEKH